MTRLAFRFLFVDWFGGLGRDRPFLRVTSMRASEASLIGFFGVFVLQALTIVLLLRQRAVENPKRNHPASHPLVAPSDELVLTELRTLKHALRRDKMPVRANEDVRELRRLLMDVKEMVRTTSITSTSRTLGTASPQSIAEGQEPGEVTAQSWKQDTLLAIRKSNCERQALMFDIAELVLNTGTRRQDVPGGPLYKQPGATWGIDFRKLSHDASGRLWGGLFPATANCLKLRNVGGKENLWNAGDGGKWICFDALAGQQDAREQPGNRDEGAEGAPKHDHATLPCVIYSVGSANEWSFERSMRATFPKCEVHTLDPTVIPNEHKPEGVAFHPWGVGSKSTPYSGQLKYGGKVEDGVALGFADITRQLGHRRGRTNIDVLKMDVEGAEWDVLPSLLDSIIASNASSNGASTADLPIPRLLLFELHMNKDVSKWQTRNWLADALALFRKLYAAGYRTYAVDPNPHSPCCAEFAMMWVGKTSEEECGGAGP